MTLVQTAGRVRPLRTRPPISPKGGSRRFDWLPVWLLAPGAAILTLIVLFPVGRSIYLSFFDASLLNPEGGTFVGLDNYADLLSSGRFWHSAWVTTSYTALVVAFSYLAGLVTALALNRRFRLRWLARILIILPWAVPDVVAVLVFKWILDAQFGILNHVLETVGLLDTSVAWLTQPEYAFRAVVVLTVWKQFPLATLIILAGLQTIPRELHEAAEVDGASTTQRFWHVTMPMLWFVNVVLVIILTLNTFRRTVLVFTMTAGGPARATETLPVWTYLEAFPNRRVGMASAIGASVMVILIAVTVIYYFGIVRRERL